MRIGIFDSGIGGLSVLHRAVQIMPDADFVYYADEAHVPYEQYGDQRCNKEIQEQHRRAGHWNGAGCKAGGGTV